MPSANSKYPPVVHNHSDQPRSSSVASWATRTSADYQSQPSYASSDASYASSYNSSVREVTYRDPLSGGQKVEVKERVNQHNGTHVCVTNYHQRNNAKDEPKPEYRDASRYHQHGTSS